MNFQNCDPGQFGIFIMQHSVLYDEYLLCLLVLNPFQRLQVAQRFWFSI